MATRKPTPAPNTKSDTQWLTDLGYLNEFHDFMHDYGFIGDEQDRHDALSLFRQFRKEQQEAWEKTHREDLKSLKSETLVQSSRVYSRTCMSVYSSCEQSVLKKGEGTATATGTTTATGTAKGSKT